MPIPLARIIPFVERKVGGGWQFLPFLFFSFSLLDFSGGVGELLATSYPPTSSR